MRKTLSNCSTTSSPFVTLHLGSVCGLRRTELLSPRPKRRRIHPRAVWDVRGRLARLLKLHAEGHTSPQIGMELGVKPATVRAKLRALGLTLCAKYNAYKYVRRT
jgi:DNA-binding CsgD family transcriptional regulator